MIDDIRKDIVAIMFDVHHEGFDDHWVWDTKDQMISGGYKKAIDKIMLDIKFYALYREKDILDKILHPLVILSDNDIEKIKKNSSNYIKVCVDLAKGLGESLIDPVIKEALENDEN